MTNPHKPLPKPVLWLVAVLMSPYFFLLGLRELWRRVRATRR